MLSWSLTLLSILESDPGIWGLSVSEWCESLSYLSLSQHRICVTRAKSPNLVHELFYWTRQIWLQTTGLELSLWAWRRWQEFVKRERSEWLLDKADLEAKGLSLWMWQWWQAGGREEQGVKGAQLRERERDTWQAQVFKQLKSNVRIIEI